MWIRAFDSIRDMLLVHRDICLAVTKCVIEGASHAVSSCFAKDC